MRDVRDSLFRRCEISRNRAKWRSEIPDGFRYRDSRSGDRSAADLFLISAEQARRMPLVVQIPLGEEKKKFEFRERRSRGAALAGATFVSAGARYPRRGRNGKFSEMRVPRVIAARPFCRLHTYVCMSEDKQSPLASRLRERDKHARRFQFRSTRCAMLLYNVLSLSLYLSLSFSLSLSLSLLLRVSRAPRSENRKAARPLFLAVFAGIFLTP